MADVRQFLQNFHKCLLCEEMSCGVRTLRRIMRNRMVYLVAISEILLFCHSIYFAFLLVKYLSKYIYFMKII